MLVEKRGIKVNIFYNIILYRKPKKQGIVL